MDTLSHILIGAVTGEVVAGKKLGNKAAVFGALIANIPDLDVVAQPFMPPVESLLVHRSYTHAILVCALLTPILAKFLAWIFKKTKFADWLKLSAWALFSHIFTDCFNSYGTTVFFPFSNVRVAFDCMGIFDVFFILPLIVGVICFMFLKRGTKKRKIIASLALSLSVLYLVFTIFNKISIEQKAKTYLSQENIKYERILTAPLPITNLVWLVIAETNDGFYTANYNRKNKGIYYAKYFPKNYYLSKSFADDKDYQKLVQFSRGYYCLEQSADSSKILFYDLRFASFDFDGNAELANAVFVHQLFLQADGKLKIINGFPSRKMSWKRIKKYFESLYL
jgi:inner membrane protein